MHNNDVHNLTKDNQNSEVSKAAPKLVDVQTGEIVTKQLDQTDEVIQVITDTNQERHVIFVSKTTNQDKKGSKWFEYIEKLTGWKIKLFDSFPDLPLLILDKEKKELYINRDLLKNGFKEFMNMMDKLVTLLTKQTAEAYQSVTNALNRINTQRKENKAASLAMTITENGLQFPANFSLQASDLRASVISVDNELIIKTANFRMIAKVMQELPLTAETTEIIIDEAGFICPLEKSLLESLSGYSELPFTVEYS